MTVSRLQPYAVTIFAEMSALAARIGAVNLGQGFPDEDGPPAMLKTAENAIAEGVNQYPPGLGIAPLREAIELAQLLKKRGTADSMLVLIGSTAAEPGRHNYRMPLYTLSKSLVPTLCRVLATELAAS